MSDVVLRRIFSVALVALFALGAAIATEEVANAGGSDSDGDGLSDDYENRFTGTDPNDPDTDDDGLNDAAEVYYRTNPHDPDTDDDGIQDGPDNCKRGWNPDQLDIDGNGRGDFCGLRPASPPGDALPTDLLDPLIADITALIDELTDPGEPEHPSTPPPPDLPGDLPAFATDGVAFQTEQTGPSAFVWRGYDTVTNRPVSLALAESATATPVEPGENSDVGMFVFELGDAGVEMREISFAWRYDDFSRKLYLKVAPGETVSGALLVAAPPVAYPDHCLAEVASTDPTPCEGPSYSFFNATKDYFATDPMDAVPTPVVVG